VPKFATLAVLGETITETNEAAITVTVADAILEVLACDTAVTVTCAGVGVLAGAV
jgi:hypothetical protein